MTLLLTLFFGSLLGIALMLGRKIILLDARSHRQINADELLFEIPHIEELSDGTIKGIKKLGYTALVMTLKAYVKSSNVLKENYNDIMKKLEEKRRKNMSVEQLRAMEDRASNFLEMMSEYKHKIRKIKHRIAEEEGKSL